MLFLSCVDTQFVVCIGHLLDLGSHFEPQRLVFLDESLCS